MNKIFLLALLSLLISSSCMKSYYHKKSVERKSNENMCIAKSEEWIIKNSKFPNSYTKLSFTRLEETAIVEPKGFIIKIMRTVPNSERFSIIHKYYLKDSTEQIALVYSKFIYDKDFNLKGVHSSLTDSTVNVEVINELNWKAVFGK